MSAGRTIIGARNGVSFKLRHDRLCNVLAVPARRIVWHLWTAGEYRGNFPTQAAAWSFMDEQVAA